MPDQPFQRTPIYPLDGVTCVEVDYTVELETE